MLKIMNRQELKGGPPNYQTVEEYRDLAGKLWPALDKALARIEEYKGQIYVRQASLVAWEGRPGRK